MLDVAEQPLFQLFALFESLFQVVRQVDPKSFCNFEEHPQRRTRLVVFDMRDGCPAHSNGSRKRGS